MTVATPVLILGCVQHWVYFFCHRPNLCLNYQTNLSQFGHIVRKGRLVNIVVSFNTIIGQMTEMSQLKK